MRHVIAALSVLLAAALCDCGPVALVSPTDTDAAAADGGAQPDGGDFCPTRPHTSVLIGERQSVTGCPLRCAATGDGTARAYWNDCDGLPATGCEVDTHHDPAHCGACGHACRPGVACVGGFCGGA